MMTGVERISPGVAATVMSADVRFDDPVPETLEVSFLYRLRDERKFETAEELKAQILKDIRRAERYFRRLERFRVAAVREDAHFRQPPAKGQWNKNP